MVPAVGGARAATTNCIIIRAAVCFVSIILDFDVKLCGGSMDSTDSRLSAEGLSELAQQVEASLAESTEQIRNINDDIHVLSINAKIEAARAGNHGTGFGVVADHIRTLVARTNAVTEQMESHVRRLMGDLAAMSAQLGVEVRGQRFQQVAFNTIDIIDRNLYERSCDVRWWATDASLVDALVHRTTDTAESASRRLGVILDSYTVYFDLVLADSSGVVVANGRPGRYRSLGSDVSQQPWFRRALATKSGDEFAEQSVHRSELAGNEEVLAYAATVREDGQVNGTVLGVLGILFRWRDLADGAASRAVQSILDTE
ncbi:MAG: methyl-accepting chemotaxis protein, partial [Spirochaetaceae bacterium]